MIRCIDVSRWQGRIDWRQVKQSGVAGAWVKVGGADGSLYADSRAAENLQGVESVDLPYGTYYFASPRPGDAARQARHAHDCGHGRGPLPPAIDLEAHNGLSGPQLDRFCREFCDEVMRLTGRESIVYTGAWIGVPNSGSYFGYTDQTLAHCHLWIANYGANIPGTNLPSHEPAVPAVWAGRGWSMWQFNSTTRVPGIPDNVVDQSVVTNAAWAEFTGASGPSIPEEWTMRAIMRNNEDAQFQIVVDGYGRYRRVGIPSLAFKSVLIGAGVIDGPLDNVHVITDQGELDAFNSIPESNPTYTADVGALVLAGETIRQVNEHTSEAVASIPGSAPQAAVDAGAIVDEIVDRLKD